MHDIKDILTVLAPFLSALFTTWLTDKRSRKKDDHTILMKDYHAVENENKELRKENERLRKELENNDSK